MLPVVHVLDYGAGNVRSVCNAIKSLGYSVTFITSPADFNVAEIIIFPGVGNITSAMAFLNTNGYADKLREYILANKRYLGICLGLQTLFDRSEECPHLSGLGIIPGTVQHFPTGCEFPVPHIGWNGISVWKEKPSLLTLVEKVDTVRVYFVHTYRITPSEENKDWICTTTKYGNDEFIRYFKFLIISSF